MDIDVKRLWPFPPSTIGVLEIDGKQTCFTLEDQVRQIDGLDVAEWKVPNQTAIPRGRYKVVMDFSSRFQKMMPHILDVSGFTGVRFHGGNTAADTEGCILVGEKRLNDQEIYDCGPALENLTSEIELAAANGEEVWVSVS